MINDVYLGFAMSIHEQNEHWKINFKSILYEHVGCFKFMFMDLEHPIWSRWFDVVCCFFWFKYA
jgi:hypothetical protein